MPHQRFQRFDFVCNCRTGAVRIHFLDAFYQAGHHRIVDLFNCILYNSLLDYDNILFESSKYLQIGKSIDTCQPAQFAQADTGRCFSAIRVISCLRAQLIHIKV